MIIEGNVSVKAAILGGVRTVVKVYADKNKKDKDTVWILHRAAEKNIPIQLMERTEIDDLASGRTHGGLLAETSERRMQKEEDLLRNKCPFIVLVEGVEDPFNLGYIIRTLYAAGCNGLILRKRNWGNAESTILKSSAGASEYLNICMSENLEETVQRCKENGIKAYAAMRNNAVSYDEVNYKQSVLLAIGGEMRGLSSAVRKEIDQNIYIPYANDFHNALNAAAATAVLSYEVFRQRRH